MEIITVLTARAERDADLSKRPHWASRTRDAVLAVAHHPTHAGQFAAFVYDDHGVQIGRSEGPIHLLAQLIHDFMRVMQPATGQVGSGVVPILGPGGPGPQGGGDLLSHLARAQLAGVLLAERARPTNMSHPI